jgi:hypothetical protein
MTEIIPEVPLDMPAHYCIHVMGVLDSSWAERYLGLTSTPIEQSGKPLETILAGEIADQAALLGVINALYHKGHTVVSVKRIHSDTDPHLAETEDET